MTPEFRANFSDAPIVPECLHRIKIDYVTVRKSKKGSNYLCFDLSVVENDHEGSALTLIGSLREDMFWLLRLNLRTLGIDAEDLVISTEEDELGDDRVAEPEFEGKEANAEVVHDEYMAR